MNGKRNRIIIVLCSCFILLLGGAAYAKNAEAETIRLENAEGTIHVKNAAGKEISVQNGMQIYSGYTITTEPKSYAYLSLDASKVVKADESTEITVNKEGKKLEIMVEEGSMFFNVTEKLSEDESMTVKTYNMSMSIRGTSGIVEQYYTWDGIRKEKKPSHSNIWLLDGVAETIVYTGEGDAAEILTLWGGETVQAESSPDKPFSMERGLIDIQKIPGYAAVEIQKDEALKEKVKENSGMDVGWVDEHADELLAEGQKINEVRIASVNPKPVTGKAEEETTTYNTDDQDDNGSDNSGENGSGGGSEDSTGPETEEPETTEPETKEPETTEQQPSDIWESNFICQSSISYCSFDSVSGEASVSIVDGEGNDKIILLDEASSEFLQILYDSSIENRDFTYTFEAMEENGPYRITLADTEEKTMTVNQGVIFTIPKFMTVNTNKIEADSCILQIEGKLNAGILNSVSADISVLEGGTLDVGILNISNYKDAMSLYIFGNFSANSGMIENNSVLGIHCANGNELSSLPIVNAGTVKLYAALPPSEKKTYVFDYIDNLSKGYISGAGSFDGIGELIVTDHYTAGTEAADLAKIFLPEDTLFENPQSGLLPGKRLVYDQDTKNWILYD